MKMRQGISEAPRDFYTKIRDASGMTPNQPVLQTVFMNGLHSEIRLFVESRR